LHDLATLRQKREGTPQHNSARSAASTALDRAGMTRLSRHRESTRRATGQSSRGEKVFAFGP
jgi:hypothetical protein